MSSSSVWSQDELGFASSLIGFLSCNPQAVATSLTLTTDQACSVLRTLGISLHCGRVREEDIFAFSSRLAWELDNRGLTCRGDMFCWILYRTVKDNPALMVMPEV